MEWLWHVQFSGRKGKGVHGWDDVTFACFPGERMGRGGVVGWLMFMNVCY